MNLYETIKAAVINKKIKQYKPMMDECKRSNKANLNECSKCPAYGFCPVIEEVLNDIMLGEDYPYL